MSNPHWDAFYAKLMEIYWPSVPPPYRVEERPSGLWAEDEPEVPVDIYRACVMIFPDAEAWLHNPIPNLKGRTPLEVLARGEGNKLRNILMEVAWFYLPDPSDVRPWSDTE